MFSDSQCQSFYRYCVALTGDEDSAFDLLHDCLGKYLAKLNPPENPATYMRTMIRNQFLDSRRSARAQREVLMETDGIISLDKPCWEDISLTRMETTRLLNQLESRDRELLYLWAVEGYTIEEISLFLNCPKGTLLARLHRLKARIKKSNTA